MQPLFAKRKELNYRILDLIEVWNKQANLKAFLSKQNTKVFKGVYEALDTIITKGFLSYHLNEDWMKENDVYPEYLRPVSYKAVEEVFKAANIASLTPKYFYIRDFPLDRFLYNKIQANSVFLLIKIFEVEEDLITRIYQFFIREYTKERRERQEYNRKHDHSLELLPNEYIKSKAEEKTNNLVIYMRRATNLAKGMQETSDFFDLYEENEVYQIIYDVLKKVQWKVPSIYNTLDTNISNYYLVEDYANYIKSISPIHNFKLPYLKVHGNGIWRNFAQYKLENYGEHFNGMP